MYGTQTPDAESPEARKFENDVKMYGTQTNSCDLAVFWEFENDVKMYGTQTVLMKSAIIP